MQSVTSSYKKGYFSFALLRKNLARFWPLWGLYFLIWFFAFPVATVLQGPTAAHMSTSWVLRGIEGGVLGALVFGVLSAMAVFSYLYQSRSAGFFHALPLRREGLFFTNYLSGLLFFLIPHAGIFLLTLGAQAMVGLLHLGPLCMWFFAQSLLCLFFYSFAVFCAMFTGNLLALPLFYGILNGLVLGMAEIFNSLLREFLFGFQGWDVMRSLATYFTPVAQLTSTIRVETVFVGDTATYVFHGLFMILLYALAGLVLAGLALWAYRRRHLETAGDVVSIPWVRPVFKYGVALCSATVLGSLLYSLFGNLLPKTAWTLLVFLVFCGVIGYFAGEMLLQKSFRVFRRSWKGAVCFTAALVLITSGIELDVVGFERRMPALEQIASVSLSGASSSPQDRGGYTELSMISDPEEIAALHALHATIVAEKSAIEATSNFNHSYFSSSTLANLNVQVYNDSRLTFNYTLKDGSTLRRAYRVPVTPALLAQEGSPAAQLSALVNRPAFIARSYFSSLNEDTRLVGASLSVYDTAGKSFSDISMDAETADALLAALKRDIAAGRLRRYLLDDQTRFDFCTTTDLYLQVYTPATAHEESGSWDIVVTPQTTATDTLAVLRAHGILDDTHVLLTHTQQMQLDRAQQPQGDSYVD